MIRVVKNYNFEILPFMLSSEFANYVLSEGEWGYIEYDATSGQLVFKCLANGAVPGDPQGHLCYPIIRGSDWFLKQTALAFDAMPPNAVACLEKKPGLIIETDKFTGTINPNNKLTIVGQENKGAIFKVAGPNEFVIGICLARTVQNTIIVRLV